MDKLILNKKYFLKHIVSGHRTNLVYDNLCQNVTRVRMTGTDWGIK